MNEPLVVRRETHIAAPRAAVFAFLTDPEKIIRWMGSEATTQAHPGGLYLVKDVGGRSARGSFREVVPVHRLAYMIAGQGTLGLEIIEDLPGVDTVVLPVGGGGLAAGVSVAIKAHKPQVQLIGVQTAQVPSLPAALNAGAPTPVPSRPTLADGINVPQVGAHPFPLLARHLSDVVLVTEPEIVLALLLLLEGKKVLAEGAGAAAAAAFLGPLAARDLGRRVVLVVSGGNIDIPLLERVVPRALLARRRLLTLRVALTDYPGSLGRLTTLLGEQGANILHLFHDRLAKELPLDHTRVELNLETRGPAHGEAVLAALRAAGFRVEEKP